MTSGYRASDWADLFVAAAGAGAALAGLIFVALSVNLDRVLKADERSGRANLTGRALEAVLAPLLVLSLSLLGLVPALPRQILAVAVLVVAGLSVVVPTRAAVGGRDLARRYRAHQVLRLLLSFSLSAALLISGLTLLVGRGGGLYWLVPAFLLAVVIAAGNAWILLVEILR